MVTFIIFYVVMWLLGLAVLLPGADERAMNGEIDDLERRMKKLHESSLY